MTKKKVYIETYGCQMNFSDSEIVAAVMSGNNFEPVMHSEAADVIFLNTCSIRDHAEQRVLNRLKQLQALRRKKPGLIIGVLGCMAERLKTSLLEEQQMGMRVDMVAGPDAYRDLPQLMMDVESGHKAVNVLLSSEETYAGITPVRYASGGISAYISIMRGCENFCAYCVVPYTRGKERSRNPESIMNEAKQLFEQGYREITLLGQNVNSYRWISSGSGAPISFPELLSGIAGINPLLRLRFATSHPKDMSDELLQVMALHPNICRAIHLPVQSGSSSVLTRMNRKYTREDYLQRISAIRRILPGCAISTDIICGFCGETEQEHQETISLMESVGFDFAFMFKYSERPGTLAAKKMKDDVPEDIKAKRLEAVIRIQQNLSLKSNRRDLDSLQEVLVEGHSKRSKAHLSGRSSTNKVVIFPDTGQKPGSYAMVKITACSSATLRGEPVTENA